jgi:glycosyltransferase involved in cell wall biosynthesis
MRRAGVLLLVLAAALVAPQLRSGTELVRARNALSLGDDLAQGADWAPPAVPSDFKLETRAPDPYFVALADQLGLAGLADDWERTLAISRHLLGTTPKRTGGAIQSDLETTHLKIVDQGAGYCGDFVRVFTAIANAAGMVVRPWAFSFDGFGGHGHIWVEVWNRRRQAWELADVFQNYQYVLADGVPLSAAQTRAALIRHDPQLQLLPLSPVAPPGWAIEAKARDYLQRGLAEWYAPWGNNVMSVDGAPAVRWSARASRALEGLAAFAVGLQPEVRLLAVPENAAQRSSLRSVRNRLAASAATGISGLLLLAASMFQRRRTASIQADAATAWPRICVVGPLPPPSGGMANQCEQLVRLLRDDGASVELVRSNSPYQPAWIGRVPMLRALFRLVPYLATLWRAAGRAQVVHVLANSGWAWHLFAGPVLWIGRVRGTPVVVNYRGGEAESFFSKAPRHVLGSLRDAAACITPSPFLQRVFLRHGLNAEVIPNVIDIARFNPRALRDFGDTPHLVVARNLEAIYDIPTALQAFVQIRHRFAGARMTVAGSGCELERLRELAHSLGVADAVDFPGRVENADMPALYARADGVLNPSRVDNMPISLLEAFASGVPVVSTDAGGIPDMVDDGVTGLLVPVGDAQAMAAAALRLLQDRALAERMTQAALTRVRACEWLRVRELWLDAYRRAAARMLPEAGGA